MIALGRATFFPTVIIALCVVSGCGDSRGDSQTASPSWSANQHVDNSFQSGLGGAVVEPAVRRETLPSALHPIEPVAGGILLSDQVSEAPQTSSSVDTPTDNPIATTVPTAPPVQTHAPTPAITPIDQLTEQLTEQLTNNEHRLASTTNLLVLGSDRRRNTSNWRTDVIMLIALDIENASAGVISFPRDIFIDEIPGSSGNRINTVDYLGERNGPGEGPRLLSQILSRKLGVSIDHYVRFEFDSFRDVVDALGGLTISVDCPIFDEIPEEDLFIDLSPGTHQLDGEQALAFVRTRRSGGDLERIRRQQRVVWAMRQQFLDQNWLPRIPALYSSLSDAVQTNLGPLEIAQLVRLGINISEENVHGLVISPPDMLEQNFRAGMFVFDADWPLISQIIESVFDRPPFTDTNTVGPGGDQPYCP